MNAVTTTGTPAAETDVFSDELVTKARAARTASRALARASAERKSRALEGIAALLTERADEIIAENALDCVAAEADGLSAVLLDRLLLTEERVRSMAADVRAIADMADPVGEELLDGGAVGEGGRTGSQGPVHGSPRQRGS